MTGQTTARAAGIELETVSATFSGNDGDYFYYEGADGVMVEEYLDWKMAAVTREVVKDSFISVFCQPSQAYVTPSSAIIHINNNNSSTENLTFCVKATSPVSIQIGNPQG